ncbi:MAG: OmpA family protein [Rhodobacteraceae bacterium]|nr:OmpA family protein [Paracoccaceae bacterium]
MESATTAALRGAALAAACLTLTACSGSEPLLLKTQAEAVEQAAAIDALDGTSMHKRAARNALMGSGVEALMDYAVVAYMDQQELTLRRDLSESGVDIVRVGNQIHLVMAGDATFAPAKSDVTPAIQPLLDAMATVANTYDRCMMEINGHTDSVGPAAYNRDLSQERANNVAAYLIEQGVMGRRLIVRGLGETLPHTPTADGVDEPRNRRVEIRLSPLT